MRLAIMIGVSLVAFSAGVASPMLRADDVRAKEALEEALALLEIRKVQTAEPAEQAKIDEAIAALQRVLRKEKVDNSSGPAKTKRLAGRTVFNPKTHELTVAYDFSDKNQLGDFTAVGGRPVVQGKVLRLGAGQSLRHVAQFKTLTVAGLIEKNFHNGPQLNTSAGIALGCGGGIFLRPGDKDGWMRAGSYPRPGRPLAVPADGRTGASRAPGGGPRGGQSHEATCGRPSRVVRGRGRCVLLPHCDLRTC